MRASIAFLLLVVCAPFLHADPLKVMGSSIPQYPMAEAARLLRAQKEGLDITVSASGGTQAGLAALGAGSAKLVMMAREIQPEDRAAYPALKLTQIKVAQQVAALCVSPDIWNSGIHQLSEDQVRSIYEGRIKNWKELGGPDQKLTFFNWSEGFGMWELLAEWLYSSVNRARKGVFEMIDSNEAGKSAVEFTSGSIALMSPKLAKEGEVYPIALSRNGQKAVEPTPANIASGSYPLTRPLVIVFDDKLTGEAKAFVDFLLTPQGQGCFQKRGYFSPVELQPQP